LQRSYSRNEELAMKCFSGWTITSSLLMSALLLAAAPAATAQGKKAPSNPVGAGWDSKVKQADGDGPRTLTSEQMQSIEAVNTYFNNLSTLKGSFAQTNPDSKVQRGKFYLMRPGRFRFDYNRPSRQGQQSSALGGGSQSYRDATVPDELIADLDAMGMILPRGKRRLNRARHRAGGPQPPSPGGIR